LMYNNKSVFIIMILFIAVLFAGCSSANLVKNSENQALVNKYTEKKAVLENSALVMKGGGCASCGR